MSANKESTGSSEVQKLAAKDELCLSAFVDGECGWLKRFFARRVLQNSFEARLFVDELERTSDQIQRSYGYERQCSSEDLSLWPRIHARIAQEERLTLLRSIPLESNSSFSWASRLSWGGLGAVAASILMVLYVPVITTGTAGSSHSNANSSNFPYQVASNSSIPLVQSSSNLTSSNLQATSFLQGAPNYSDAVMQNNLMQNFRNDGQQFEQTQFTQGLSESALVDRQADYRALQLASLQAGRQVGNFESANDPNAWKFIQQEPNIVLADSDRANSLTFGKQRRVMAPQVFEVDWVRSKGRVRVLQDPSGKAAIIWVNRPQNLALARAQVPPSVMLSPNSALSQPGSVANSFVENIGNR